MDRSFFESPDERLVKMRAVISRRGAARTDQLAADFGVSEMTIRRDLDELEELGVVRRVHGGAIALGPEPFADRHRHNARAKARIADKLRALVPASGTIAVDASSTVHRLASSLAVVRDLVVVTNGVDTFQAMVEKPGVTAALTGGAQEPRTGSLVGPVASRAAGSYIYDSFFCSAAAVDDVFGSSEATIAESEVKRDFAGSSSRLVLAVDQSKLGTRAEAKGFGLEEIDLMVTDLDPNDPRLDPYRRSVELL
jgi:DeoR family fructose operon transcriptional repressor